jgi:hypothetical protein
MVEVMTVVVDGAATGAVVSRAAVETETTTVVLTGTTVELTDPTEQMTPGAQAVMVYDWVEKMVEVNVIEDVDGTGAGVSTDETGQ